LVTIKKRRIEIVISDHQRTVAFYSAGICPLCQQAVKVISPVDSSAPALGTRNIYQRLKSLLASRGSSR
jgi:hypothetical protein